MAEDAEGFLRPQIDEQKCTDCGKCARVCPLNRVQELMEHGVFKKRYFALSLKNGFPELYGSTTSGAAYRIARAFLHEGLVCGCRFNLETLKAEHVLTSDPEVVKQFCGSKYVQSTKGDVFSKIKEALRRGTRVLFIGLPCEAAGLKALCTNKEAQNLYTIDLICHGTPSPKALSTYLSEAQKVVGQIKKINFRHRLRGVWEDYYSIKIEGTHGVLNNDSMHDAYALGFLRNLNLRESCYSCPYKNAQLKRPADLTLGDFWQIEKLIPQFLRTDAGVSQILVNSEKGARLVNLIRYGIMYSTEVTAKLAAASNIMLSRSVPRPHGRSIYYKVLDKTGSSVQAFVKSFGIKDDAH